MLWLLRHKDFKWLIFLVPTKAKVSAAELRFDHSVVPFAMCVCHVCLGILSPWMNHKPTERTETWERTQTDLQILSIKQDICLRFEMGLKTWTQCSVSHTCTSRQWAAAIHLVTHFNIICPRGYRLCRETTRERFILLAVNVSANPGFDRGRHLSETFHITLEQEVEGMVVMSLQANKAEKWPTTIETTQQYNSVYL